MQLSISKSLTKLLTLAISLPALAGAISVSAQSDYYGSAREPIVSIYEDCDFRGERRDIAVADFRRMSELDFGNDEMSSIRVPRELEVIIYEHDNFKGDYARVGRDVSCFDGTWNDEVSSLKVQYRERRNDQRANNRGQNPVYGGQPNDGVTGNNVVFITFNNLILQNIGSRKWETKARNRSIAQYNEMSRDRNSVVLQNDYSAEKLRIDLVANEVFVLSPRGQQQRYQITSRKADDFAGRNTQPHVSSAPSTRFPNRCIAYKVFTNGKPGGIRFSTGKDFYRFQERGHQGRICHRGEVTVELNKRDFDADLTFEVDGRVFKFAAGEKETQFRANWYRKVIKLQVGY